MICNMPCRMGRNVDDGCPHVAQLHYIPATHLHIQRRNSFGFCRRPRDDASRRGLNLRIAANMIRVPMRVPNLGYRPPACFGRSQNGRSNGRIDHQGFPALRVMDQPDIIVRQDRDAHDLKHVYHAPILGMLAQGSAGARLPSCSSSIEIPSGVRTNAM